MPLVVDVDAILRQVEDATDEIVDFAADLIRIPTVNPPGEAYEACAHLIGDRLSAWGFDVGYHAAVGRPEHTARYPRVNIVGTRRGARARPCLHLNGHFDVVPAGEGWTRDPFEPEIADRRLYGRGAADMKAGLAAAVYATEAVRRAGVTLAGTLEVSGTVDEESGGLAGVAWLAEQGLIGSSRTDYVIIPEPFGVDRISVGHRGVYWADVVMRGRVAHGSMPFLGVSAVEPLAAVVDRVRAELVPALEQRVTAMPVVPAEARCATVNVNTVEGGQTGQSMQTPCVPDWSRVVIDRRFLPEESFDAVKAEIEDLVASTVSRFPGVDYELQDRLVVHPVRTPENATLVRVLRDAVQMVLGRDPQLVASPGTYDHKHVAGVAGVEQCVAFGPGRLELAHQPDEWCDVEDLVTATKILALAVPGLTGQG